MSRHEIQLLAELVEKYPLVTKELLESTTQPEPKKRRQRRKKRQKNKTQKKQVKPVQNGEKYTLVCSVCGRKTYTYRKNKQLNR